MKSKTPLEEYFDEYKNEDTSTIDLTKPPDNTPEVYSPEEYINPAKTWCSYMEREFRASRTMEGTQTVTHINSPAHLKEK